MMVSKHEKTGGITPADIGMIHKKIKVGDKIRVKTLKAASFDQLSNRCYGIVRYGIVVEKYPRFAVVEFPGGVRESVLWIDMIKKG